MDHYGYHCRPELVELLELVGLDARYVRSQGDYLWRVQGETTTRVLDLVGGYGTNLFGHCHPELVARAKSLLDEGVPGFVQCSLREGAGQLAQALVDRVGPYVVVYANSGTETVEAALKHAYLERSGSICWAVRGAFHGKTLGAIQLTSEYGKPFSTLGPVVRFLDPEDPADWEEAARGADQVVAAFIEPIQGEGGIRCMPARFIDWLRTTCAAHDIPIIADEIQSGMGRTGTFLACEQLALEPDYICLGKSLGGGIAKLGALLIKRDRYVRRFSIMHSSTFAEDDWSCLIALRALEILDRDKLPARCAKSGLHLIERLRALQQRFPEQIRQIRGVGLMVGIDFADQSDSPSTSLRLLSQQDQLGYFIAAYLLNVHAIRVLPTLSHPSTLRIEPSAYIEEAELDRTVSALESCCHAIEAADITHLIQFRIGVSNERVINYRHVQPCIRNKPLTTNHVAFIGHLGQASDAVAYEPSLAQVDPEDADRFLNVSARLFAPAILSTENIRSATGELVHLSFIGLSMTAHQMVSAWHEGNRAWISRKIEEAVTLARDAGCRTVGLGGHTSILSGNGRRIRVKGVSLTTGNSLTVGMAIRALKEVAQAKQIDLAGVRLGVVGATGNIAAAYATILAPDVKELVLVVRETSSSRVTGLVASIQHVAPHVHIEVSESISAIRDCQLIVAASNAGGGIIHSEHLGQQPTIICDIAVPSDVAASVSTDRPEVFIFEGGVVRVPENPTFSLPGIFLEPGFVYACMAETLLMGLERIESHGSYGAIDLEAVDRFVALADKHGFALGGFRTALARPLWDGAKPSPRGPAVGLLSQSGATVGT